MFNNTATKRLGGDTGTRSTFLYLTNYFTFLPWAKYPEHSGNSKTIFLSVGSNALYQLYRSTIYMPNQRFFFAFYFLIMPILACLKRSSKLWLPFLQSSPPSSTLSRSEYFSLQKALLPPKQRSYLGRPGSSLPCSTASYASTLKFRISSKRSVVCYDLPHFTHLVLEGNETVVITVVSEMKTYVDNWTKHFKLFSQIIF